MHDHRGWALRRSIAVVALGALLTGGLSGCKTQDDAVAAAAQMAKTATTLCAYYDSMDKVVTATEDTFQAQSALDGIPPPDPKKLEDIRAQLLLRKKMATKIANIATALQKITGSTAAKDSATAAGNFNTELVKLNAISSNDFEAKVLTESVQLLVQYVQANDEIKAARQIEPVTHALAVFYQSEKPQYDHLNDDYLTAAASVSHLMVSTNQVGTDPAFLSALKPFDLTPTLSTKTRAAMQPYLQTKIDKEYKAKEDEAHQASRALGDALNEMDVRVSLVTHQQPMRIRTEPLSLETAKGWIAEVTKEVQ